MALIDEIGEQPQTVRATVETLLPALDAVRPYADQLRSGKLRSVLFAGMGASYNATFPAVHYLLQHGIDARAVESADLLYDQRALLTESTLLVIPSQSGRSIEVRRMAELDAAPGPVIGITNNPDSPLAQWSDVCLVTQAGHEVSVACKTYTATLAALYLLATALAGEALDPAAAAIRAAADEVERRLDEWRVQAQTLAAELPDDGLFVFLGRGPSEASALAGALIFNESAKIFTNGMTGSMFRHGPIEVLDERTSVFILAGSGATREINLQLAQYLVDLKGRAVVMGAAGDEVAGTSFIRVGIADAWALPIVEIVPLQLLAVALCDKRGIEPGSFRYLRKVAQHE